MASLKVLRKRDAKLLFEERVHGRIVQADVMLEDVLWRDVGAQFREHLSLRTAGEPLAVDEHAIAIEDYMLDHHAAQPFFRVAAASAITQSSSNIMVAPARAV